MTESTTTSTPRPRQREEALSYLAQRLNIVTPMLNRFVHMSCKEVGLRSPRDLFLLTMLSKHPVNQARFAKALEMNAPTLSKQIDALVTSGFVTREASAQDRRVQTLTITREGKAKLDEVHTVNEQRLKEMLAEATDVELDQLLDVTNVLTGLITSRIESKHGHGQCPFSHDHRTHESGEIHE